VKTAQLIKTCVKKDSLTNSNIEFSSQFCEILFTGKERERNWAKEKEEGFLKKLIE
jgi:hypothetical protein